MAFGFVEIIFSVFTLLGGSMGLPLGLPPGDEDARMSQFAPEECLFYACWSGVDEPDGNRNPTEKWMAQPGVSHFLDKFRKSYRTYLSRLADDQPSAAKRFAINTLTELASTSFRRPAAVYCSTFELGEDNMPEFDGAVLIQLDQAAQQALTKITDSWGATIDNDPQANPDYRVEMVDGIRSFQIRKLNGIGDMWIRIDGDQACLATSLPLLKQARENLKTPPPTWLQELRKSLPVQRFASVGYLDLKGITETLPDAFRNGFFFDLDQRAILDLGIQIGSVSGVDDRGFLTRTEIRTPEKLTGLWSLLDCEPLPREYLETIPGDAMFAIGTRIGTDRIVSMLKDLARQSNQEQLLDEAMGKLESFTGVSLEDELISCLGNFVSAHFDYDINQFRPRLAVSIRIEDDMVFPGVFEQINLALEKSITESWGNEAFETKTIDKNTFFKFKPGNALFGAQQEFVWGIVDERLVVCLDEPLFQSEIKGFDKGTRLVDQKHVQELFEFADREGLGNPVMVMQFDLGGLFRQLEPFIRMLRENDWGFGQELDFRGTDLPPPEEWYEGVEANVTGVYRTKRGFQIYQRQTYPGASPMVTSGGLILWGMAGNVLWGVR